ncbi:hypothetical protein [Allosphingosinicella vermicomposti]|uniref:hypothetical protein n=1 Tax=Allosphingosinicella vermicomposti TaxID=614671 RepID=UPI000D0E4A50|nr:hypothetical protein [Allosphingosinicella vermicomposti]
MTLQRPIKTGEQGYILITAIWLLLLAGSIAALLVLRSLTTAADAADRQERVENQLILEAGFETVFADRLVNGISSPWWLLPAEGRVTLDGASAHVRLTSESGRIDINEAEPALIAAALQGLGVSSASRDRFLTRLQSLRAQKQLISSFAHLRQIEAEAIDQSICLEEHFTFTSGLVAPRRDHMSAGLSRALGYSLSSSQAPAEAGAALRVQVRSPVGQTLIAVARFSSDQQNPLAMSSWSTDHQCINR